MSKVAKPIQTIIEGAVRRMLGVNGVVDVVTTRDEDFDGDEIFTVRIVLNDDGPVAPSSYFELMRDLRRQLGDVGESAFPILRLMSKKDFELVSNAPR